MPPRRDRVSLFAINHIWGFHIFAPGVYLLDQGLADHVEFWDFQNERSVSYHANGILKVVFLNPKEIKSYLEMYGYPDLYINHGVFGHPVLKLMEGKCFRVHVPAFRQRWDR